MKQRLRSFLLLAHGFWAVTMGCEELDPECAWLVMDFTDCPATVINCPDSPYYDPGTNGYNLVAAFGECTSYGSSTTENGVIIQATTAGGCISEERMVFTLCGG